MKSQEESDVLEVIAQSFADKYISEKNIDVATKSTSFSHHAFVPLEKRIKNTLGAKFHGKRVSADACQLIGVKNVDEGQFETCFSVEIGSRYPFKKMETVFESHAVAMAMSNDFPEHLIFLVPDNYQGTSKILRTAMFKVDTNSRNLINAKVSKTMQQIKTLQEIKTITHN